MPTSTGQHSNGADAPLPPLQEHAPGQSSPTQGEGGAGEHRSSSVEGVITQGTISPYRPLSGEPFPTIDTHSPYAAAASPTLGRYPAPLSPTGIGFPAMPYNNNNNLNRGAPGGSGPPGDPFQSPAVAGETSSMDRPPSGGRSSRRVVSGVYAQSPDSVMMHPQPQGPGSGGGPGVSGMEADITDHASHAGGMHSESLGPAGGVKVLPASRRSGQGQMGRPTASVEDEKNALEWIVPNVRDSNAMLSPGRAVSMTEKRMTVRERLQKTLDAAVLEHKKYDTRSKQASLIINAVTYLQIVSNALITGLSAATTNRNAQIGVSALGAINTIISSFLVRVRASREPERSVAHAQTLEKYIREMEAFMDDEGGSYDRKWDNEVKRFRVEFDKLQTAVHQAENGQPVSDTSSTTSQASSTPTAVANNSTANTHSHGATTQNLAKMV